MSPYRTSPEPPPAPTPVPWRCRWFGHTYGTIVPIPGSNPLVLLQKCGRGSGRYERGDSRRCEKWQRVDVYKYGGHAGTDWRELHEVWPDPSTGVTNAAEEITETTAS